MIMLVNLFMFSKFLWVLRTLQKDNLTFPPEILLGREHAQFIVGTFQVFFLELKLKVSFENIPKLFLSRNNCC